MKLDSQFPPGTIRRITVSQDKVIVYPYDSDMIVYIPTTKQVINPAENTVIDNTAK